MWFVRIKFLVHPEGFEPPPTSLEPRDTNPLCYGCIFILYAWRDSNSQESVSCSAGLSNRYVSPIPPQTHIILYPHRNSNPDTWCLRPIRLPVTSWGHLYFCIPGQIRTGTLAVWEQYDYRLRHGDNFKSHKSVSIFI